MRYLKKFEKFLIVEKIEADKIKLYISEGKIKSKYSQAKNVTDIVEFYAKELVTIKISLNTLSYKFKDLLHKLI
jgi:hypothetical protein